ncbi:hypothetical protein [Paraburkholderia adhaesiva]|uniref:hypothetical protein n=1 Tax=Paraburkholderia adhaesiva TaxID=2883244 RepID=UPI001F308648|nr:hypothetical protein [Paraburkholderia adhaesiva]
MKIDQDAIEHDSKTIVAFVLEVATKSFVIIGALALAASVMYDWGFLFALNLSFADLPSTMADHVRRALDWIPEAATFAIGTAILMRLSDVRREKREIAFIDRSERNNKENNKDDKPGPSKPIRLKSWLTWPALIGLPALWLLLPSRGLIFPIFGIYWILFYGQFLYSDKDEENSKIRLLLRILALTPPLLFTLWDIGRVSAVKLSLMPATESLVYEGKAREDGVTVLRYLEKGVLIKGGDNQVSFVPWSEIHRIDTHQKYAPYAGLVCYVTKSG